MMSCGRIGVYVEVDELITCGQCFWSGCKWGITN